MIIKTISTIDKNLFNGYIKKIYFDLVIKKKRKKKIQDINFSLQTSEKKIILLSDLLNKSCDEGVIVECGVGNGFSLTVISKLSKKKIYAFDSFSGFPHKVSENDKSDNDTQDLLQVLKHSKFHYKLMTVDLVKKNMLNNKISEEDIEKQIVFKKGYFPESFQGFNEKISFLHLDVDLYDSYKECLKFFFPKMAKGGIITFDEYIDRSLNNEQKKQKGYNWYGAKVAIDEFVKIKNLNLLEHTTGYKYIVID
ncbi:TylF/MycF family methyltransferase [Candidatus Pelagibacter sp.]|nr:TylF/MycF family methyltransferase [Candidatus Pelagibacter sp.]